MSFITVPDTAKVAIEFLQGAQRIINTLYFHKTGGWDATALDVLAEDVAGWVTGSLLPLLISAFEFWSVTATDQGVEDGEQGIYTPAAPVDGGVTSSVNPNHTAVAVTFRTIRTGRSYRGRNYVAGLPGSALLDEVHVSSAFASNIAAAYAELDTVETASDCTHVVASRQHNLVARVTGVVEPVIAYSCDTSVDSMRRRLAGRGV